MKFMKFVCALGILSLFGCVNPAVNLSKINRTNDTTPIDKDYIDTFYLQKSEIAIDSLSESKDAPPISITSTPREMTDYKIGIKKGGWFWTSTNLNTTKRENTELVKEAGVEVTDYRIEILKGLGDIAKKSIAFKMDETDENKEKKKIEFPIIIDSSEQFSKTNPDYENPNTGVSIKFGPLPPDARPMSTFSSGTYNGLIYAACRSAKVTFIFQGKKHEKVMKVSDPHYFQYIAFPDKGSIAFHSECGVSVKSEKDTGISPTVAVLQALMEQIAAAKGEIDKSRND